MTIKEVKKEVCQKVNLRRDAICSHSSIPLVSSPRPRTLGLFSRPVDGIPPVTSRPISPMSPTEEPDDSPNTSKHDHGMTDIKDNIDYQGLSVDWILDSPFFEVSKLLRQLDLSADSGLILEVMLHYTLVINGLPDCPDEDVPLAVYFFVEDTFGIKSRLMKCVKIHQCGGRMNVGVAFETIRMKFDVLNKNELLEGTEVKIVNNHSLAWFGIRSGAPCL